MLKKLWWHLQGFWMRRIDPLYRFASSSRAEYLKMSILVPKYLKRVEKVQKRTKKQEISGKFIYNTPHSYRHTAGFT